VRVEVPLRWGDLDAQGHVNNARFIDYLQDARADFLRALGIDHLLRDGFTVVSNQIEYRAPVYFSLEPLQVDIVVTQVDADSVALGYQLYQKDRQVALAKTALSGYDLATRTRVELPPDIKALFAEMVEPTETLRHIDWMEMNERAKVAAMRVRWSDLDSYGHVNNAMIFDYLQEGRITFTAAPFRGMENSTDADNLWLLLRQDVWYLNSVSYRLEPYLVRTGISRMGRTSLTFSSQLDDPVNDMVCSRASAVAVFADARGVPTPLTDEIRRDVAAYLLNP